MSVTASSGSSRILISAFQPACMARAAITARKTVS
jgi:hypothetical protein